MPKYNERVAVIVDLVGSRSHSDRALVHSNLLAALELTNSMIDSDQPLAPTIGDECQARYFSVDAALLAVLVLRLVLPEGMDCRAGIGVGHVEDLGVGAIGPIQDGPAWWAARDAIIEVKRREQSRNRTLRTWYQVTDREGFPRDRYPDPTPVNAFLLTRDELVSEMSPRSRRLLLGLFKGESQAAMALSEGVTSSAVSQNVRTSGALAVHSAHQHMGPLLRSEEL